MGGPEADKRWRSAILMRDDERKERQLHGDGVLRVDLQISRELKSLQDPGRGENLQRNAQGSRVKVWVDCVSHNQNAVNRAASSFHW